MELTVDKNLFLIYHKAMIFSNIVLIID